MADIRSVPPGRIPIALACTTCGQRNYRSTRTKRADAKPITMKKFCRNCNAHTVHLEAK